MLAIISKNMKTSHKSFGMVMATVFAVAMMPCQTRAIRLAPQQAVVRAIGDRCQTDVGQKAAAYMGASGKATVYAIRGAAPTGGMLFVSASDCARPVLGYTDNDIDSLDDLPEQFGAWLRMMSEKSMELKQAMKPQMAVLNACNWSRRSLKLRQ